MDWAYAGPSLGFERFLFQRNFHFAAGSVEALQGQVFRRNEIWRDLTDTSGATTSELVKTNIARTLYEI